MATKLDSRQVVLRDVNPFIGNAANEQLNVVFPRIDAEMAKLYEDRNVLLTDGGIITFTGTQIQFTENLNIVLNQKISGAAPQVISLGSATVTLANNEMLWTVINRTAGTAVLAQGTTMPAVIAANQEVFLIVKRVDAGDGTQRIYWRTGMAQNAGQSNRLGASGSGSGGSGTGDDLIALLFRASFRDPFEEGPTDTKSAVDVTAGKTDAATYNAAKAMYVLNYDASKTIAAATTTTNINISAVAAFTVKIGDMVINNGQARRITAVATQASFTTEAFTVAPTLASQVTISQAVHTKDVYNFAVDGNALSAAFSGATFQDVLVDLEDTSTALDNIFDVNVAPVIAFSASQDGTTYTDNKTRSTLETDIMQSFLLPAAGTGLFMRFFALKTSGSGTVNILGYRAFMQKLNVAVAGGITNSSYAFTNGVGTPINATVSLAGGKTTITLPWSYATGVYPGTTASSIEVWLNGQKLPRFVNSTLTPDGSFLETSANIVTLDRDYSGVNLSVEIFQRTQIVDNSTTNTTNIAYQQEIMQNGFQAFTAQNQLMNATTSTGAPGVGSFHSTVVGRAPIVDLAQDMKVRMGPERMQVQTAYRLQTEFGPNGEQVWGTPNDLFGQIRFVGNWGVGALTSGPRMISQLVNDYVEVTFYGTGLRILNTIFTTNQDIRASVDGGAEGANLIPAGTQGILATRNYNTNQVLIAASGLSLGVHTVKIRNANVAGSDLQPCGFEIVTDDTALRIPPGVSYINGQKLTLASLQSISYNSGFETGTLGTRGGRVIVYQKSDTSIAKSVQPTDGSQGAITASGNTTTHQNEEVTRTYNFREFGAGRTDDLSTAMPTSTDRAFALEDGTTLLVADDVNVDSTGVKEAIVLAQTANSALTFTFVGTGLDIFVANTSAPSVNNVQVTIDGQAAISVTGANWSLRSWNKIASGLPYGTHVVRFSQATGGVGLRPSDFKIWGPKKPTVPSGAVELADYNILATFVANATQGAEFIGTGVLRKALVMREAVYVGTTWSIQSGIGTGVGGATTGFYAGGGNTAGAFYQHTFFGTGFDLRITGPGTAGTYTMTIDGVTPTNAGATGSSFYGVVTAFSNATGTITTNTAGNFGSGVVVTGLPLGTHTVRVAYVAGNNMAVEALDVITPIHVQKSSQYTELQNALPVGSTAITDSRKLTPVKDLLPSQKGWAQALGVTSNPTTTSTALIPMPDMSVMIRTNGGRLDIRFKTQCTSSATNPTPSITIFVNGFAVGAPDSGSITAPATAGNQFSVSNECSTAVPAGFHKVDVYYNNGNAGTLTLSGTNRILTVEEA